MMPGSLPGTPPVAGGDGPGIAATDRHVAAYVALERRRFELLGSWVASTPELEVKVALAAHARHHAWHASLWEEHLPRRSGYQDPGGAPALAGLAACLEALAGDGGPDATVERLAGAYRVVAARAVTAYRSHLAAMSVVSDGALARTCRFVLADQADDWHHGEALLQSLLDTDTAVERAAARQATLERLVGDGDTGAR